ncbi:hypothetical protein ACLMJK_004947 [Lecanora helva]
MAHLLPIILALLLPLTALAHVNITTSAAAIECSLYPSLCPDSLPSNSTQDLISNNTHDLSAHKTDRIKPEPPTVKVGLSEDTATGDVLNTTHCFCASPNWRDDHTYGYYHAFAYYNFHHASTFSFEISCASADYKKVNTKHHHDLIEPACLKKKHKEKWCTSIDNRGERGNTFCYEFNGGGEKDSYRFNNQKRGLPHGATWRMAEIETLGVCDAFCRQKVSGLIVLDGEALTAVANEPRGVGPSAWSAILSFGETDDMCMSCR